MLKNLKKLGSCNITKRYFSQSNVAPGEPLEYCANIVRQYDYENYLATLLMTNSLRSPAFVLRAFNVEISRIQDQTKDAQIAAMRLQFWQDTLESIYKRNADISEIPANPVAKSLFQICNFHRLPKRYLDRLILSRKNLLTIKYNKTLEDLENNVENSVSSVYYLLLCIAGVANVHADHAASHIGKAQGITNILRSVQVCNHHKTIYLPMDILMKHEVSQESVLRGLDNSNMRDVIYEIASRANSHLEKAKNITVPKITSQIFLPAVAVNNYLKRLQKTNFDIFNKSLQHSGINLPLKLYYCRLLNKY